MKNKHVYLGLDVGTKRIGVALADSIGRIAHPLTTVQVDGAEIDAIAKLAADHDATHLVLGLPRDQSGGVTAQTGLVRDFARRLEILHMPYHWQDESVTSILAEERLSSRGKPYAKAAIDAEAAAIILQDFMETLTT